MQPTPNFDPVRLTKSLLRRSRQGALATLLTGTGDPYCALANIASHPDGSPIILISSLAVHTRNIVADNRVSLMLDERSPGDPLEGARIMLVGRAEAAAQSELELVRRRYLSAHPSAEAFVSFADFSFYRIRPAWTHLVAGFGRIVDLKAERFIVDLADADALVEAEPDILDHMNADHRDTMNLYATRLLGAADADWRCSGCDPEGIDMQFNQNVLRLEFPQRVATPAELRKMLVRLADEARQNASDIP